LGHVTSVGTLLSVGHQEEHLACKNRVMRCWHGCLSGVRCNWFALWSCWCHWHHIISCFIKIQNGFTFLVPAYPGC